MAKQDVGSLKAKVSMDSVEFNQGIKAISQQMSIITQEFKNASGGLDKFKDAAEITRLKITQLSTNIEGQKKIVDQFREAHQKAATEFGEGSKKALDYELKLKKAEGTLAGMERALVSATAELKKQESAWTALSTKMTAISTKCNEVGTKLSGIGKSLSMSVTAPILAAGAASIKMASDFNESVNKVDVAFKDSAGGVKSWADTTLKSFGIAEGTALDMAAKFGDMSTSMGMSTEQAAAMSTRMVGLAGDLASFKNISIDVANTALTGVFTGETESLKQLGIVMTQANLQEYAYAQGIRTKIADMSQAEQVQLRYNYILANTTNAQGDFARTSEGTANQMRIFGETMKELGANIGTYLLPVITPIIAKLTEWVQKFGELDDGTKKVILVIAGIAAAIGPVLLILGSMITAFATVAGVVGAAGAAIATAGGVVGSLGLAFAAITGPIGIAVAAIAALVVGGIALYRHLSSDAIPAVKLFGNETSAATEKAVGAYMDLDGKASQSLMNLKANGETITTETANGLIGIFDNMGTQIKAGMDEDYAEDLQTMKNFFANSAALSDGEEAATLARMASTHEAKKAAVEQQENQIAEILKTASNERRALTADEQSKINSIQATMKENAIKTLSATEVESTLILERMKAQAGEITALQAAEVAKNSIAQKNAAVESANACYDETIRTIIKMRDETGVISREQADVMIAEAGRAKDETVKKAEEMNQKVVEQARIQAGGHVNEVEWETGEIKSKWQVFGENIERKQEEISVNVAKTWKQMGTDTVAEFELLKTNSLAKWDEFKTNIGLKAGEIKTIVLTKWGEIKNDAIEWGGNIIQGLVDGITDKLYAAKQAALDVASSINDALRNFFSIASPSRLMFALGANVVQGLADGISENASVAISAAESVATGILGWVNTALDALRNLASTVAATPTTPAGGGGSDDGGGSDEHDSPTFVRPPSGAQPDISDDEINRTWAQGLRGTFRLLLREKINGTDSADNSLYAKINNATTREAWKAFDKYAANAWMGQYGFAYAGQLAAGGIATRATLGVFGEAGPEAILPLRNLLPMMTEALKSAINVNVGGGATSKSLQTTHYNFAPGSIIIPAKDLAEMRSVQDFFNRFPQVARAMGV